MLSQMLALPDNWNYSIAGLAYINREGERAVRSAINELEQAGYLHRRQKRGNTGKIVGTEYMVYEQPVCQNAAVDNPPLDKPPTENSTQLNKDKQNKDKINIEKTNPILSDREGIGLETNYAQYERLIK
ncbi:helix-turn-helix domain-containing protein [Acutalibacter muris]|uniref:helix-turn-helix domain-containing protein n=1 Tax=Acutalibacter muris TaxID=1796620 RepID=UPI0026F3E812|nr:helix-turn-helix domain-containing protein [Acutalibacter muris]